MIVLEKSISNKPFFYLGCFEFSSTRNKELKIYGRPVLLESRINRK